MSEKSKLPTENFAKVFVSGLKKMDEAISLMNEAVSILRSPELHRYFEQIERAVGGKTKKDPPIPPQRNNNNNNSKEFTLSPQTPLSHEEPESDLAASQKKKKMPISAGLQQMAENGNKLPAQWKFYAEKKGIKSNLVPIFQDFVLYHSRKNSKFANWYAAWQTWVRNQIRFDPGCMSPVGIQKVNKQNLGDILEN